MIDQSQIDLSNLVGRTVPLHREGRTLRGRCPIHQGTSDTSLMVSEGPHGWRWRCWAGCNDGRSGDAIAWLMAVEGLEFKAACAALNLAMPDRPYTPRRPVPPDESLPSSDNWQTTARQIANEAAKRLWRPIGARALAELRARGLTDVTIEQAGLGYNPVDTYIPRSAFGMPNEWDEDRKRWRTKVALPHGITIPWSIDGAMWKLWVRTPQHLAPWKDDRGCGVHWPKYRQTPGGGNGPWGIDAVQHGKPIMLCEGVFDALAVQQEAGDLITPIVTGTTGARRVRWIARLAPAPLVLLSFDADRGGIAPTIYWRNVLPRTRGWWPYYDDPAAMLRIPGTVRAWVQAGLDIPSGPDV